MSTATPVERAKGIVLAILTVDVVVLAVTGIVLYFTYRPDTSAPTFAGDTWLGIDFPRAMTTTHRLAAQVALPTALAAAVLMAVERRPRGGRLDVVVGCGMVVVVLLASLTGPLLPWDQLALWAVTVGNDNDGYGPLLDDGRVRFVFVGNAQIAPATLVRWLAVHTLVVGAALIALLVLAWRHSLRHPPPPDPPPTE
jgi:quinol-cytochrome oxidoreductase complex cytochrome b subunit